MSHLTIAVSTVFELSEKLNEKINCYLSRLDENISFLVIVQRSSKEYTLHENPRLKVIFTKQSGLSKSRNMALRNCSSSYVWFQDDDIDLNPPVVNNMSYELCSRNIDLMFLKIESKELRGTPFKPYDFHQRPSIFNSFKISSIEIVIRCSFQQEHNIWFDENLGLGTNLPSCEENLFSYQLIRSSGGYNDRIGIYDGFVASHTTLTDQRNIDIENRVRARGYLIASLSIIHGLMLFVRWSTRHEASGIMCRLRRARLLIAGVVIKYFKKAS